MTTHPLRLRAFIAQVDSTGGPDSCWPWRGRVGDEGYGGFGKGSEPAHRVAFELMVRPIGEGLNVDHVCHNNDEACAGGVTCQHRRCVNPTHLDAVTQRDNLLRSRHTAPNRNAVKTHCPRGHEYTPENTYSRTTAKGHRRRECKTCRRDSMALIRKQTSVHRPGAGAAGIDVTAAPAHTPDP